MRNLKIVRYSAVLLGLVVLRTKAQNGFCPMCTKECCIVLTRPNPFWGQFWGQICETDSDSQRSNKCAALVSLRNMNTSITGFLPVKSPTNLHISLSPSKKLYASQLYTILAHRPCRREKRPCLGAFAAYRRSSRPVKYSPKIPTFRRFFLTQERLFLYRLFPDGFHLYRKSLHK